MPFIRNDPLRDILETACGNPLNENEVGIEVALFENGRIIISHTAYPYLLHEKAENCCFQYPSENGVLAAHSAVFIAE